MASFVHLIDQRRLIGAGGSTISGKIYFYYTGTTVKAPIYNDAALLTPIANPVEVAAGEIIPLIFLDDNIQYRRVIEYSDGSVPDTQDPVGNIFSDGDIGLPVGSVIDFSGTSAPAGFIFCFGQEISRADYAELFTVIGTTYGNGNGTTTFNLPDYRGRVGAGKDNMGGVAAARLSTVVSGSVLGAVGGGETATISIAQLPSHGHPVTVTDPGHTHGVPVRGDGNAGIFIEDAGGGTLKTVTSDSNTTGITASAGNTGSGQGHNNVQPTIVVNKIIKTASVSFLSMLGVDLAEEAAKAVDAIELAGAEQIALAAAEADRAELAALYAEEFGGPTYASTAAGVAATTVGQFFRVWNGDSPRTYTRYERTGTSPFYAVASPLATTADLASTASGKGASLVGLTQGGNAQQGIRNISPDMKGAVSGVNSDASMTTWANAGKALALGAVDYQTTTTLFPQVQGVVIDGEGGTITNTNTTSISANDQSNITMMIGYTNFISDNALTPYSIASVSGCVLTLTTPSESSNFAVGDLVFVHGATSYNVTISGTPYQVYTYQTRARVEAVSPGVITLDRGLCEGLATDSPVIGNFAQGVDCGITGISPPQEAYLWYAPKLQNLTLASDQSNVVGGGGVIDGVFRNITTQGRNGWALNAMQDCLVDGLRFVGAWRKIVELAEGSSGTTIRNVRGTLLDGSTKSGGSSDVAPFGCAISENCEDCTFEDFDVSSGPNDFGAVNSGVLLGSGRRNKVRNSVFNFPALTGYGLTIQANATAGNPNNDCTYENITLNLPVGNRFINVGDGGAGINRPVIRNVKAFGTVSSGRAVSLMGNDGVLENCWFEDGNLFRAGTITGWTIRGNYFPDGFDATINDTTFSNNNIYDNDSAANRLLRAAALRYWPTGFGDTITTTTANSVFKFATFPAGSLSRTDMITVFADFSAAGTGAAARNVRLSVLDGASTLTGAGSTNATTVGPLAMRSTITILSNTTIRFQTSTFTPTGVTNVSGSITVADLSVNPLTINLEAWNNAGTTPTIIAGYCEILPRKRGMIQLPSFAR